MGASPFHVGVVVGTERLVRGLGAQIRLEAHHQPLLRSHVGVQIGPQLRVGDLQPLYRLHCRSRPK